MTKYWCGVLLWCSLGSNATIAQTLEELEARLKREQAAEAAQQAEANRKAEAARKAAADRQAAEARAEAERKAAEAALGTLIVKTDRDCALSINGEAKGALVAEQTTTIKVNAGEQLIECVAGERQRIEVTERIPAGEQKVVRLTVPPPGRFAAVPGGVQDYEQGLIWAARDNGSDIDWASAGQYCRSLGAGWSLPTAAQLQSLYDASGQYARSWTFPGASQSWDIKFATPLIQWTSCCFWSAESNGSSEAWYVSLADGGRGSSVVSYTYNDRALCVRRP